MDNQQNNQTPLSQEPIIQDPIPQEPIIKETPILETQAPEPELPLNEPTVPSVEYQKILDDYATTVKPQPEPEPQVEQQASVKEQLQDLGITNPPSTNNIFKIIFTIALVIFILVIIALGFTYFKSQKNSDSLNNKVIETTPTPISTAVCSLNDKTYKVGESFPSADGCNTCTCETDNMIACTEKACAVTHTKTATTSAVPKDWKTYTNSTYKYSIQYPNTWKLTTDLTTLSKSDISLSTPEWQQAQLEAKGNMSSESCGFYYISCFKSVSDFDKETTIKSLSDYLISKKGSPENNYSIVDKVVKNNQTTYEVNGGALRLEKYYFIEKSDFSFCKIEMCGSLEKITSTDRQFVDTFKFN